MNAKNIYRHLTILFAIILLSCTSCSKHEMNNSLDQRDSMILNDLEHADSYYSMHPALKEAFDFLKQPELANMPVGRYEIKGDQLYCMILKQTGGTRAERQLEAHQKYIDIHYVINGVEEMGWKKTSTCHLVHTPYDAEKDYCLFNDQPETWTQIQAGSFALFFPEDAHAPMVGNEEIHKAVIKVMINP